MVRKVRETGEIGLLEAHRVKQSDEHFAIAGPVMDADGQRVLGVVHLMLPLSLLPSAGGQGPRTTHFQFRQQANQQSVVIRASQSQEPPPHALTTQIPVPETTLLLYAWGGPGGKLDGELRLWLAAIYGAALVLLALLLWLPYRGLRRGVEAELASIVALAEDAVNRRPLRASRHRIAEFRSCQAKLRGLLRELPSARAVVPRSESSLDQSPPDEVVPSRSTPSVATRALPEASRQVPAGIFRAYDVRGLLGSEITPEVMRSLGLAVGSEARARGDGSCFVARDQRPSGESLSVALMAGLRASGCDVIDLGLAPTPVLYYAAHAHGDCSAAMITASHNPAEYNGLKVVLADRLDGVEVNTIDGLRAEFAHGWGLMRASNTQPGLVFRFQADDEASLNKIQDLYRRMLALVAPKLELPF